LYMVMEMCKKGVVMKVGLEEKADPYDDEQCRCWFFKHFRYTKVDHFQNVVVGHQTVVRFYISMDNTL
jgi:[calcium/calmodulin-dependent protein kinase] kinase